MFLPRLITIIDKCPRLEMNTKFIKVRGDIQTISLDSGYRLIHREEGSGEGIDPFFL